MSFRGRSSFRSARTGKPIHPVTWCGQDSLSLDFTDTTEAVTLCSSTELDLYTSPTIMRLRGTIHVGLGVVPGDLSTSIGETHVVRMAIGVFPNGIGTYPDLEAKAGQEYPWLWMGYCPLQSDIQSMVYWNGSAATVVNREGVHSGGAHTFDIDSKARRRVPKEHGLVLVMKDDIRTGGWNILGSGNVRALIKE